MMKTEGLATTQEQYLAGQSAMVGYLHRQLIGPRSDEHEELTDINPSDLYMMGMLHPIDLGEDDELDEDKEDIAFQKKQPC